MEGSGFSLSKGHCFSFKGLLVVLVISYWEELKVAGSVFASFCLVFLSFCPFVLLSFFFLSFYLFVLLGRVKSELEQTSVLAEFCAQVKSEQ